jgi:hypothetical protein
MCCPPASTNRRFPALSGREPMPGAERLACAITSRTARRRAYLVTPTRFSAYALTSITGRVLNVRQNARGCVPLRQLSETEAAYLAGIIDGEGTVTLTRTHRGENRRPVVSISSTELPLLLYVRSVVGAGRITSKVRAQDHHSPSFAYTIYSRQALTLLNQVSPYLRTYKAGRACLLLEQYVRVTPRNGRYTPHQRAGRQAFEQRLFANSVRARAHIRQL